MRKAKSEATKKFYVAVGKKIAEVRRDFPKTQEALATDLKVNRATIVNIERGRQQLLLHTIVLIARSLKVTPENIIPQFSAEEVDVKTFVADPGGAAWIQSSSKSEQVAVNNLVADPGGATWIENSSNTEEKQNGS